MTVYKVVIECYDFHDCNSSRKYWDDYASYMVEDTFENVSKFVNELNRNVVTNYISALRQKLETVYKSRQEASKKNKIIERMNPGEAEVLGIVEVSIEFFDRTLEELIEIEKKIESADKLLNDNNLLADSNFTVFGYRWTIESVETISLDKLKEILEVE